MRRIAIFLTTLFGTAALFGSGIGQGERMRHFNGPGFTFRFVEPEGWVLDGGADQLAHFVLHEQGVSWRRADPLIYVRLVPRKDNLSADQYLQERLKSFETDCPLFESQRIDFKVGSPHHFLFSGYDCADDRQEIVALTEVHRFFIVFVLSNRSGFTQRLGLPVFKKVLDSFGWETQPAYSTRDNRN